MAKRQSAGQRKVHRVMTEYKNRTLKSGGSGRRVTSRKQALAIALSTAGRARSRRKR